MVGVTRRRTMAMVSMSAALVALSFVGRSNSQPPAGGIRFLGDASCKGCHGEFGPKSYPKEANEFLLMNEHEIWSKYDVHSRAFAALSSDLGKRMGAVLGYDVAKDARCLTCHAIDLAMKKPLSQKKLDDFYTASGVGCEACHGIAKDWYLPHTAPPTFREAPPKDKEALDMWDMRNPKRRAERCASCHVGSESDGRFVTHEMFAAGHPPLQSLEVMRFSKDQKQHYRAPGEVPFIRNYAAEKDAKKAWELYHYRSDESAQARQFAVGAIMALRANAELLARKAEGVDPAKDALDLAHFDCYGCHHDLQSDGWRKARGFIGVPGRPQIRPGSALLAKIVAEHAAAARNAGASSPLTKFGDTFKALTDAFDARPFGETARVKSAAEGIVAWCDAVLKELDDVRYTKAESAKLLKQVIAAGLKPPEGNTNPWVDADAAQQLLWAVSVLSTELDSAEKTAQLQTILGTVKNLRPEVRNTSNNELIAGTLSDRLKRQNSFEPNDLYSAFGKMADAMK